MGVDAYLLCERYIDFTHERRPGLRFGVGVGVGIRVMRRLLADAPAKVAVGAGASRDVVPRVVRDRGGDDLGRACRRVQFGVFVHMPRNHAMVVIGLLLVHGLVRTGHHGVTHGIQRARNRKGRHDGVEMAVEPDALLVHFPAQHFLVVFRVHLCAKRVDARKLEHDHGRGLWHGRETLVAGLCIADAHFLGQKGVVGRGGAWSCVAKSQLGHLLDERAGVLLSLHRAAVLGFKFVGNLFRENW